ncbi:MAG: hypothetical protein Q9M22_06440 [Mariprofundaceae bacterium]|nr:hypothetical protein [Mariprofundaceae bacterium]
MPDIGLVELLVIGLLLFLLVGPERMPEALKQATDVVRTVRAWLSKVTTALTEQADAIKTPIEEIKTDAKKDLVNQLPSVDHGLGQVLSDFKRAIDEKPMDSAKPSNPAKQAQKNE